MLLNNQLAKKEIMRKLENTLRQIKMKTQNTKTYCMLL